MGKKRTLLKELCPKQVQENSFVGGPGGQSGILNYSTGYGTPGGGNVTQDPAKFNTKGMFSSNGTESPNHIGNDSGSMAAKPLPSNPNHLQGKKPGSALLPTTNTNAAPENLGGQFSPQDKANAIKSQTPLNPDQQYDGDVDQIFKKKQTPTPDEIMSALQYELGRMVKKDKTIAKKEVLKNLKENPRYYSELDMLNIDDKKMKIDEGFFNQNKPMVDDSTLAKTKAVLDEMIAAKKQKVQPPLPNLDDIFKGLHEKRYGISSSTKPESKQ